MVSYQGNTFENRDQVMDFIRNNATEYDITGLMAENLSVDDFYDAYKKAESTDRPQEAFWNWMSRKINEALYEYVDYEMDDCCDVEEDEND